jgi:hypothetical protein
LEAAGFRQVNEIEVRGERDYDSPQAYWEMFTEVAAPIAGALSKADEPARERVKTKVLKAAEALARGGRPVFTWSAWVASGVK